MLLYLAAIAVMRKHCSAESQQHKTAHYFGNCSGWSKGCSFFGLHFNNVDTKKGNYESAGSPTLINLKMYFFDMMVAGQKVELLLCWEKWAVGKRSKFFPGKVGFPKNAKANPCKTLVFLRRSLVFEVQAFQKPTGLGSRATLFSLGKALKQFFGQQP